MIHRGGVIGGAAQPARVHRGTRGRKGRTWRLRRQLDHARFRTRRCR